MRITTIAPARNEEGSIRELVERLYKTYEANSYQGQIILAANGCTDGTVETLKEIVQERNGKYFDLDNVSNSESTELPDLEIEVVGLNILEGHKSKAIAKALNHTNGDYVMWIDADLQYAPEEMPELIEKLDEGFDFVSARRIKRQDPFHRKAASWFGNKIFSLVYNLPVEDINSGIKAARRKFFEEIDFINNAQNYNGLHWFLVPIAIWKGMKVCQVDVTHYPRTSDSSYISVLRTPFKGLSDYFKLIRTNFYKN